MKYSLKNQDNILTIEFDFNKSKTLIYLLISILIISFIIFNLKTPLTDNIFSLSISLIVLTYLSFIDYIEWFRHKKHVIVLIDSDLHINNKFIIKKDRIKSIFIEYINSQIEGEWRVYIDSFNGNNRYIFKERLSKDEAIEIAYFINKLIEKDIVLIKARGIDIIHTSPR